MYDNSFLSTQSNHYRNNKINAFVCEFAPDVPSLSLKELINIKMKNYHLQSDDKAFKKIVETARDSYRNSLRFSIQKLARMTMARMVSDWTDHFVKSPKGTLSLDVLSEKCPNALKVFTQLYFATRNKAGEKNKLGGLLNVTHITGKMAWAKDLNRTVLSSTVRQLIDNEINELRGLSNTIQDQEEMAEGKVDTPVSHKRANSNDSSKPAAKRRKVKFCCYLTAIVNLLQ